MTSPLPLSSVDPVPESSADPGDEEARLAALAGAGDRAAFRALYERYAARVARHVVRVVGAGSDVEDITQEVFVQLHRSLGSFRGECKLSTFVYRLTWNVAVSHGRRRRKVVELTAVRSLQLSTENWNRLEARDLCRTLDAALAGVSDDAREAFLLSEVEGMKLREIAELTGEPLHTIAARVRRTRAKLRAALENADPRTGKEASHDCL